ncbi:hypothetical protein MAPG_04939 [Magnaporthiopsis poae ATCC 64411]|uniref:Uncharacterized protein n=1 Tax=Magnaporthiopsis poae (strain ATCC 64411 / 73-15) TaxID=644358 RepID=A0A0C4DY30_MAGP6|nr:hypothetical protein MAPG_04939 [Magnaporthiopsis poae ATCC 64411]
MADLPRAPYDPEFDPLLTLKQLRWPDTVGLRVPSRINMKTTNSHHLRTWEALVHHICATLGRDYIRKDLASVDTPVSLATLVSHLGIQRTSSRAALVFLSTVAPLEHLETLLGSLQADMPRDGDTPVPCGQLQVGVGLGAAHGPGGEGLEAAGVGS